MPVQWLRRLMGRELKVQYTPALRSEWEKQILRAELPTATKTVALAAAAYGNPDGSNVGPSVARLAVELDWSEKHVQNQLTALIGLGLLQVKTKRSRHGHAHYRLTFPADISLIPNRTDVDGYRILAGPRKPGRGGAKPKLTGTPVPVKPDADRNPSSGQGRDDRNWSSGQEAPTPELQFRSETPLTGTPVPVTERSPELEFPLTGTGVPHDRNPSSGDHTRPYETTPMPGSYVSPTSTHEHHDAEQRDRPETPDTAETERLVYAAARTAVANTPIAVRDRALTAAAMQLAGIDPDGPDAEAPDRLPQRVDRRQQIVVAAEILDAWRTASLTPDPGSAA